MKYPLKYGFTLIEIVVVISIIAMISILVSRVLISMVKTTMSYEAAKEVKQNGNFALDTLVRLIQNAKTVDISPCPDIGATRVATTAAHIINLDDSYVDVMCSEFSRTSRMIVTSPGKSPYFLTTSSVSLWDGKTGQSCFYGPLQFVCTSVGGKPSSVLINFGLSSSTVKQIFSTTVSLRN